MIRLVASRRITVVPEKEGSHNTVKAPLAESDMQPARHTGSLRHFPRPAAPQIRRRPTARPGNRRQ
jgi:hypothetical protein